MTILMKAYFSRDACELARRLLGKVIRKKYRNYWLAAQIIETEAYYLEEKGSHASLGYTDKRKALFMPPGTIYMYYARGSDSLNISCQGEGNAVLIKSAIPFEDNQTHPDAIKVMQRLNPLASGKTRPTSRLCSGQTLLCRALDLKVPQWDQRQFDSTRFYLEDVNYSPEKIIQTTRLGIPQGRDEDLPYRFIDYHYVKVCSSNPLTRKNRPKLSILLQEGEP